MSVSQDFREFVLLINTKEMQSVSDHSLSNREANRSTPR
jgi:hypothetical protein